MKIARNLLRLALCLFFPWLLIVIVRWEADPGQWSQWIRWVWLVLFVVFVYHSADIASHEDR